MRLTFEQWKEQKEKQFQAEQANRTTMNPDKFTYKQGDIIVKPFVQKK
ncbi:hypothetical protein ABE273_27910 [Bacillus paranthracis]|nr:hypothetical protein [Bacillus pacificus]MCU5009075.1 hypothetical protein [Bacillus pacificus]